MFNRVTVQSVIEDRLHLQTSTTGWHVGKCPLCGDYKVRAGFKCDGEQIVFNCWNCSTSTKYEEFSGKMSRKFRSVLNAYGIDDNEINSLVNSQFFTKPVEEKVITLDKLTKVNTGTPPTKLPPGALPLGSDGGLDQQERIAEYLLKRKVDLNRYKFFFSPEESYKNRVIVPFYRAGKLIYWQARDITGKDKDRYKNAAVSREAIMFNMDKLTSFSTLPLFVTEGVFDAMMVDGVSILGSKLNPAKEELLTKTKRRLVFVIDKDANGAKLARRVLELGYEIAFAPAGSEDLNQSAQRYGLCWTVYELMKTIPKDASSAALAININCR